MSVYPAFKSLTYEDAKKLLDLYKKDGEEVYLFVKIEKDEDTYYELFAEVILDNPTPTCCAVSIFRIFRVVPPNVCATNDQLIANYSQLKYDPEQYPL